MPYMAECQMFGKEMRIKGYGKRSFSEKMLKVTLELILKNER